MAAEASLPAAWESMPVQPLNPQIAQFDTRPDQVVVGVGGLDLAPLDDRQVGADHVVTAGQVDAQLPEPPARLGGELALVLAGGPVRPAGAGVGRAPRPPRRPEPPA